MAKKRISAEHLDGDVSVEFEKSTLVDHSTDEVRRSFEGHEKAKCLAFGRACQRRIASILGLIMGLRGIGAKGS